MKTIGTLIGAIAIDLIAASAVAQDVNFRLHHSLPAPATIPSGFLEPWVSKVEADSADRIGIEVFPSMQLGGKPSELIDQVKDGRVDIVLTRPGYTSDRFPKTGVFELPFMPTNGEQTSKALWEFYETSLADEFRDYKVLATWVHGAGLLHVKGEGVRKLEDMKGLKLSWPSRVINQLLSKLDAIPVGLPGRAVPDALSKGVIDGAIIPWVATRPLLNPELKVTHTEFTGDRLLYTSTFVLLMNKARYDGLPEDLKAAIDRNSGIIVSADAGRVMDAGDVQARKTAVDSKNEIVLLDNKETARWQNIAKAVETAWVAEMSKKGIDAKATLQQAKDLITKHSSR